MSNLSFLMVLAHPDDEADIGGSINTLAKNGCKVSLCTLVGKAEARRNLSQNLESEKRNVIELLGIKDYYSANFPNIKMNTVPHLDLVQFVERCIIDSKANAIITHHPADVNNDHAMTSFAVQAACRLFQRRNDVDKLKLILFCESACATEWSIDSSANRFNPNTYISIGEEGFSVKEKALYTYEGVVRPFPHPNSIDTYRSLCLYRGSQAGVKLAEAFECVFRSI